MPSYDWMARQRGVVSRKYWYAYLLKASLPALQRNLMATQGMLA